MQVNVGKRNWTLTIQSLSSCFIFPGDSWHDELRSESSDYLDSRSTFLYRSVVRVTLHTNKLSDENVSYGGGERMAYYHAILVEHFDGESLVCVELLT